MFAHRRLKNGARLGIGITAEFSNSVTSFFSKLRLVSGGTFLSMMPTMSLRNFWQLTSVEK
jgi:hypothetical protein